MPIEQIIEQEKRKRGLGNPRDIQVLMYHRIVRYEDDVRRDRLAIHIGRFRRQMEFLEGRGFTSITFEDYRLFLEGEINLPRKPVIIWFEEAYLDTYELAFPILRELGMKAIIFVVADPSIRRNIWDALGGGNAQPLMNERQIIEVHSAGFEIGSHSLTHADLTALPREAAWEEISRSRMLLEIMLNAPVKAFAYPYGALNSETKRMVADAGYTVACSIKTGPPILEIDPLEIRPVAIHSGVTLAGFAVRISAAFQKYRQARWQLLQMFSSSGSDQAYLGQ